MDSFLQEKCGVIFAENDTGQPDLAREGAHSVRRIYHWMDCSGKAIHDGLLARVNALDNLRFETGRMTVDLITACHHSSHHEDRCRKYRVIGAYVLDVNSGFVEPLLAPISVIGGCNEVRAPS